MARSKRTRSPRLLQDGTREEHRCPHLPPSYTGYTYGCRCAGCTAATREYQQGLRARRRAAREIAEAERLKEETTYVHSPDAPLSPEYAAGFFDGEGCVNITSGKHKRDVCLSTGLRVMIVNTDERILDLLKSQFGGRVQSREQRNRKWKTYRCLTLTGTQAVRFLNCVRSAVVLKKPQVELAFEYWEFTHAPRDERYYLQDMGQGNFRGERRILTRRPEVVARDLEFKERMHALNRKGPRPPPQGD